MRFDVAIHFSWSWFVGCNVWLPFIIQYFLPVPFENPVINLNVELFTCIFFLSVKWTSINLSIMFLEQTRPHFLAKFKATRNKLDLNYDMECTNHHPSLSTLRPKWLSHSKMKWWAIYTNLPVYWELLQGQPCTLWCWMHLISPNKNVSSNKSMYPTKKFCYFWRPFNKLYNFTLKLIEPYLKTCTSIHPMLSKKMRKNREGNRVRGVLDVPLVYVLFFLVITTPRCNTCLTFW